MVTSGWLFNYYRIGGPIGLFYGYEVAGIFQKNRKWSVSAPAWRQTRLFKYRDPNNDKVIDNRSIREL